MASGRGAAFLFALAISTHATLAAADEASPRARVAITWTRGAGAESCISPEDLVERTRARVPPETLLTLERPGADFVLEGHIERRGGVFRTELALRDAFGRPLGERTFDSPKSSCRAVDEPLVLALVLLVETLRGLSGTRTKEAEDAFAELVPPLQSEPITKEGRLPPQRLMPPSPPRARPAWGFEVGAGATMAVGFLPKPTAGIALAGVVVPPRFVPLVLRGAAYPFRTDQATVPGEGIAVRGLEGGADVCPVGLSGRWLGARACAGVHAAALDAAPLGPRSSSGTTVFALFPVRAEVRARLGSKIDPYAAVAARFAAAAPTFVYRAPDGAVRTSFAVPWATVELELGLVWHTLP